MAMGLEHLIGKGVILFFNDGQRVSRKQGTLVEVREGVLFFKENGKEQLQGVPLQQLIRLEEVR